MRTPQCCEYGVECRVGEDIELRLAGEEQEVAGWLVRARVERPSRPGGSKRAHRAHRAQMWQVSKLLATMQHWWADGRQ